jgi:branched-chain amino acid transport system ATP-binding protein
MSAMLVINDVTAGYVRDIDILRNLTLTVERGTVTGLIGLNGAGKSTVMKTICGFLWPNSGSIEYDGSDITGIAPHRLIDLGIWYIPQESSLFPFMTVEDNLNLPLNHLVQTRRGLRRSEAASRFEQVLVKFPVIGESLRKNAGDLSGGQQKMLEFAKAYLVRPRLCLIDEPSIGLAPKVAEAVYQWIELFANEGMTILLVDHNVRRVVAMSGYIYVLSLGQITAHGRRADFAGDLHDQLKTWLGIGA